MCCASQANQYDGEPITICTKGLGKQCEQGEQCEDEHCLEACIVGVLSGFVDNDGGQFAAIDGEHRDGIEYKDEQHGCWVVGLQAINITDVCRCPEQEEPPNTVGNEFGKEEVLTWRFGVMTEFENADWFIANDGNANSAFKEYCKLYDYTVQALIDVIGEDVYVGAHAMSVTEGQWDERDFIEHCAVGKNYKTGETGTRICYLSGSFYDHAPGSYTNGYDLPGTINNLRNAAEEFGLNDLEYGIDEGRLLVGTVSGANNDELLSRTVGYTYQASYDARLIAQMFNNDIDYFSAWGYLSNGLLEGNPTVSYHVAKNAAKMAGAKLARTEKTEEGVILGGEIDSVSAFNEETNTLHIMAYNFKNDLDYEHDVNLTFNINAPQFNGKNVKITTYTIDDDCNYFDEWAEDRKTYNIGDYCFGWSPDDPQIDSTITLKDEKARDIYFNELYSKYTECSKLVPTEEAVTVEDGKITLNTTLDPHAVVFYEITPIQ